MKKIGVTGWRKITKDGDAWKLILKEARDLRGQWREWRDKSSSKPIGLRRGLVADFLLGIRLRIFPEAWTSAS